MRLISEIIKKDPAFGEILNALDGGALPGVIGGVSHIHRCALAAACLRLHGGSVVVICPEESDCTKVMADLESLTETQGTFLPVREFSFFDSAAASHQFEQRRIAALYAMAKREIPLLVTTPDALMQRTIPVDGLMERSIVVSPGDIIDPEKLADDLTLLGYRRVDTVESTGEFALRGGIIDVYSPGHPKPVRIELFGDEVDAMGIFSPDTQRRVENISKARLLPAVEVHPHLAEVSVEGIAKSLEKLLKRVSSSKNAPAGLADTIAGDLEKLRRGEEICADRYMHIIYPPLICAADYIPGDATVIMVEPGRCQQRGENYAWQMNQDIQSACEAGKLVGEYGNIYIPFDRVCAKLEEHPVIMADSFIVSKYPINPRTIVTATVKQLPGYGGSFDTAVGDIRYYVNNNYSTLVLAGDEKRAKELDMATVVCADSVKEGLAIAMLEPDILLCEPTDLIGTGKVADNSYVIEATSKIRAINPEILVMIASGVSTADDVYNVIRLGADGTGATSGILKAPDPCLRVMEMARAMAQAVKDREQQGD